MSQIKRLTMTICLLALLPWGCAKPPDPFGTQVSRALDASFMGHEYLSEGKDRQAEKAFTKSLEINRSIDNPGGTARQLNNLAALALTRGDNAEAKKLFEQALFLNQGIGDTAAAAINLANLATIAQKSGHLPQAEAYLQEARSLAGQSGSAKVKGQVLCQMAGLLLDQQDPGAAAALLQEAAPAAHEPLVRGAWNYQQGRLSLARGDTVRALDFFQAALKADRTILNRPGMGADLQGLGQVWEAQGDFERSFLYYNRAFDLYASTNSQEQAQLCLQALKRVNKAGRLGRPLKPLEKQMETRRAAAAPCPADTAKSAQGPGTPPGPKTLKPQKPETCPPESESAAPASSR